MMKRPLEEMEIGQLRVLRTRLAGEVARLDRMKAPAEERSVFAGKLESVLDQLARVRAK